MLCAVITGPTLEEAENQIDHASIDADLLEIRWDALKLNSTDSILQSKKPLIFTLRSASQGGFYKEDEETRLQEIERLANLKPDYIDLEYTVPPKFIKQLKLKHPSIKIILSYHNFDETPHDLNQILNSLKNTPADYYKIACMANSTIDALRMLIFSKASGNKVIALCMGELGSITRIVNHFSYACIDEDSSLTKGQLSLKTLIHTYRFNELNDETTLFGLIGNPVDKSVSNITHNKHFSKLNLNAVYIKMSVQEEELPEFFKLIPHLPFKGLSVTMPLKQTVMPYLQKIDPKATKIGAVNTILTKDKKLIGFNTDCTGAVFAIEEKMPLKDKKVLILGAGGASRAIVFAVISKGATVTILNRNVEKAHQLAHEFGCHAACLKDIALFDYDLLINCTPDEMPFDPCHILERKVVMDIKSFPRTPKLLQEAEKKNCTLIFGYDMFLHQAQGQFTIWNIAFKQTSST